MTRVLLVSQYYWPESFTITSEVARLAHEGFEVTVLTGQPNYPEGRIFAGYSAFSIRQELVEGIEVIRVPLVPRGHGSGLRLILNYLSFMVSGLLIAPFILRGRRFDVVFVFGLSPLIQALPAILISKIKRAGLVLWVQDLWPESLSATGFVRSPVLLGIVRLTIRFIYRNCTVILVQSDAFRAPVAALSPPKARIEYVPNSGQSFEKNARPSDAARKLGEQIGQSFSVVFAGNLGRAQGLDTVLEALELLRDLPEVQVYLVGSGSLDEWLEQERSRRNLTMLHLPGRFGPTDMPEILSNASALLVSLRKEEIFSLTVPSKMQTYLSVGRPIIASLDGEGARILSEAGAGLAAPAGDPSALASAIRCMASLQPTERSAMGLSGQRYFDRHFAPDRITALLSENLTAAARRGMRP
jgi:glycosyltransferase involved in cell wall biosynthesis